MGRGGRCLDLGRGLLLGSPLHQLTELQLQLIEQPRAALGGWAEPRVLQLGDGELEALDLGVEVIDAMRGRDQLRLQRYDIVGKLAPDRVSCASHNNCFAIASISVVTIILRTSRRCHTGRRADAGAARSSRNQRPPRVLRCAPVDALQHVAELRQRDRHRAIDRCQPDEASPFEPLGE